MNKQIEALLFERAGYETRGLKDRVRGCNEALRALGFEHKYLDSVDIETAAAEPVVEKAVRKAPVKRKV
jgi:hypothetical protein